MRTTYGEGQRISVTVLLFAAYREILGARQVNLTVPAETSLDGLFSILARDFPALVALRPATTFAVNREVRAPNWVLQSGDEVAFLQPVSGG